LNQRLFITGIGTGVGKTVCAAVLCEALGADYWKPVQAGGLDASDSRTVRSLLGPQHVIHPEAYRLSQPISPHAAARRDGVRIELSRLAPPRAKRPLVIEGAGGLMVPLNEEELMIDLVAQLGAPAVLVSRHYLGSINHTLLSLEALARRGLPLAGLVFNGRPDEASEEAICRRACAPVIGRIADEPRIDAETVHRYAAQFAANAAAIFAGRGEEGG